MNPENEFNLPEGSEAVRASSLDTWPDCERRWMATQRKHLLSSAGYRFAETPFGIGLHVGIATHAGLAHGWRGFWEHGWWNHPAEMEEVAMVQLQVNTDGGRHVTFDRASKDLDVAESAARKMMVAYRLDVPAYRKPELIEQGMVARVGEGLYLTGHCDLYSEPDMTLEDYKTGVMVPQPQRQVGAYVLNLRANGRAVRKSRMTWMRRVGKKTDQPPPMTVPYDPDLSAFLARQTVKEIADKLQRFKNQANPDPFTFRANPSSKLCGAKYCPAYNTEWCPESKAKALFTARENEE